MAVINQNIEGKSDDGKKVSTDEKMTRFNPPNCTICGKMVFDLTSAMALPEDGSPVHFDCALQKAGEQEHIGKNEKIIYVGSGNFAVVEFTDQTGGSFDIKRRISYEQKEQICEWRKKMTVEIAELGIAGIIPDKKQKNDQNKE